MEDIKIAVYDVLCLPSRIADSFTGENNLANLSIKIDMIDIFATDFIKLNLNNKMGAEMRERFEEYCLTRFSEKGLKEPKDNLKEVIAEYWFFLCLKSYE